MTKEEWGEVKRLLLAGWVLRSGEQIDDGAYLSMLAPFEASAVATAVRSLAGVARFTPKAAEIVDAITRRDADREDRQAAYRRDAMARWDRGAPEGFLRAHPERAAQLAAERKAAS